MLMICLNMLDTDEQRTDFERFYSRFRQDMFAVAMGILHCIPDAEDAVSQAFFSIARNYNRISLLNNDEMQAYAVIVVKNKALDIYSRNKRESENIVHTDSDTISDRSFVSQSYSDIDEALDSLDERYRDIIMLYYYYGFSAKEVSDLLGIHTDTVRHRAMTAKKLLKQVLEKGESYD